MKLTHIIRPVAKSALALAAFAGLNAYAGPAEKPAKPVVEKDESLFATYNVPITGSVDVGWDSRYYFRGLWFADNITWAGVSFSVPVSMISENLTLGFGALYTSTVDTQVAPLPPANSLDYSELDLTASLTYDFKFMKLGVVFTNYQFFDSFSGSTAAGAFGFGEFAVKSVPEIGFVASTTQFGVNAFAAWYYDFNIGGSYFEVGADYPVQVLPWLKFVPAVKSGYGLDYYSLGAPGAPENGALVNGPGVTSGFTHVLLSASTPVSLTKNATLTPYVAWNISGRSRQANNATQNEVFGGVKLSVTF